MNNTDYTHMDVTQEILFVSDFPNQNQVTKDEALRLYYNFICDKYNIEGEKRYNFGYLKTLIMTKQLAKVLYNCHAINDGVITLSMVRNFEGVNVSVFLPHGEFEYDKPFNEVLNVSKDKMENLGEEHYSCNTKHGNIKPDRLEFDTAVDPNYVIMGYDYAYLHNANRNSQYEYSY